jgi:hypothetical protein
MSDITAGVRKLLAELAEKTPLAVGELEERLKENGCSMYCGAEKVFDHSDYASDVINEECLNEDDEDVESECNAYSVTRYKMAWLGLTCGEHKVVAVLKNLAVVEKNGIPHIVAHFDLFNVIESEKLFENARNRIVARVIAERKFKELLEGLRESMPFLSRLLMGLGIMSLGAKLIEEGVKR